MAFLQRLRGLIAACVALSLTAGHVQAFDNSRSDNLAVYWGQNSYGATHTSDTANWQQSISHYCQDATINAIPIAFLNVFSSTGGLPEINLANTCNPTDSGVFSGTSLANCQFLAADIEACQANGKIVTLSLGGATGAASFSSASQAQAFADTIWNLFLGGSSSTRPFGAAVLDGIDLDIEGGGTAYFDSFINQIRSHASGASKKYYVTAAPQCPYPDAYLGTVLNEVAFDAVYVQCMLISGFILRSQLITLSVVLQISSVSQILPVRHECTLTFQPIVTTTTAGFRITAWDFSLWDTWAKTVAINSNVKVYIGAPASSTAAGSGYVDAATLGSIAQSTRSSYSSFGGIMLWDASQAYANGRYDTAVKNAMGTGAGTGSTSTTTHSTTSSTTTSSATTTKSTSSTTTTKSTTTTTSTSASSTTTTASTGNCASVSAWVNNVAYTGGQQATYKYETSGIYKTRLTFFSGHLWTAQWWTYDDIPGAKGPEPAFQVGSDIEK
ncbi:hypothetical protein H0H93_000670 [Arthromyces matolae]|nr:hypothetical protein H0H93_000670 [Arthromyces matolae]